MNTSTIASIDGKIIHIKQMMQKLQQKLSNKEDKTQQISRLNFINFLDQTIQKLQLLINTMPSTFNIYSQNHHNDYIKKQAQQFKQRYFQSQKQRITLEKKLTQLLQKQIKQQQHALRLQRAQSQSIKQKYKLEMQIKQHQQKIQQMNYEINNLMLKIKDQDKELHRVISINHKLNDEKEYIVVDRNRTEKKLNQLIEKYEHDDLATHAKTMKAYERFNIKNTQGVKIVRTITNVSTDKKNHEKYFVLELPAKIELNKIVYGVRIGVVMPNKQITYFNDLHLYEKDPMLLTKQGQNLVIDYLKRREKVVTEKIRLTKPQILILLYGKGDSVIIDETK